MVGEVGIEAYRGCGISYHVECMGLETVPRGPWYCKECGDTYEREGCIDTTLQRDLMDYIYDSMVRPLRAAEERCIRTAAWLKVGPMGDLVCVERNSGHHHRVPLIGDWPAILCSIHREMIYCAGHGYTTG